jgi:hypothetical protein
MSTTAPQPATTPIPVQLSEPEFEALILPHLSMPYTMQEEKRSNITVGVAGHFAGSTIYALHA